MRLLKGWKLSLVAGIALGSSGQLFAQKPGSLDERVLGPQARRAQPASYSMPSVVAAPNMAYADEQALGGVPMPNPAIGPGMAGDPSMMGEPCQGQCPNCGGGGCGMGCGECDRFGRSASGLAGLIRSKFQSHRGWFLPYGEGGVATQRWFDVSAEAVVLRQTRGADNFNVSSLGIGTNNIVLGTGSVDFDRYRAGLGLQFNVQTGPGSNLEVVYFGLNRWDQTATVTSNASSLYSFISNFGQLPNGGFDDSDRSLVHTFNYTSQLNNGEINFRRRWAEPVGFFQGSFLTGVRYLDLDEGATFTATGINNNGAANNGARFFNYNAATRNALVGWQVGGDLWYNLIPGVKAGVELKTGVYNNRAHQDSVITANSLANPINESVLHNRVATITQISPQVVYRVNHSLTLRSSYQFLYIDNLALAGENFNATPPAIFLPNSNRVATINDKSDVIYQGFTAGAEFMW